MNDRDIYESIKNLVDNRKISGTINADELMNAINQISDINYEENYNFLTLSITWGHYTYTRNKENFEIIKKAIELLHQKGINKKYKCGTYNAPVLFYVEDAAMFEYLCQNGYDPNERIQIGIEGFDGLPFLALQKHFNRNIYLIAKKYGFDPLQPIPQGTMLHLLIRTFVNDIAKDDFRFFLQEFPQWVNTTDELGCTVLHYLVRSYNFNYEKDTSLIELFLNEGCDKTIRTGKTIFFDGGEHSIPVGSTALDIFTARIAANSITKSAITDEAIQLLRPAKDFFTTVKKITGLFRKRV